MAASTQITVHSDDPGILARFRQEIVDLAKKFLADLSGFSHHDGVNDPVELADLHNAPADTLPPSAEQAGSTDAAPVVEPAPSEAGEPTEEPATDPKGKK